MSLRVRVESLAVQGLALVTLVKGLAAPGRTPQLIEFTNYSDWGLILSTAMIRLMGRSLLNESFPRLGITSRKTM